MTSEFKDKVYKTKELHLVLDLQEVSELRTTLTYLLGNYHEIPFRLCAQKLLQALIFSTRDVE